MEERWSITEGFKVHSTYFSRPSSPFNPHRLRCSLHLLRPDGFVDYGRRGLLASLALVVDCLYELPSICVFHGADRYDCDRRKSGDAYPAKDRPIQDPPRLLSAQPDRINAIRVFPPGHVRLLRRNPLIICRG